MSGFDPLGSNLIFVLSLPRSGSTLLQRILAGHSDIHTTAEPWLMLRPLYALRDSADEQADYDAQLARQGLEDFLGQFENGESVYQDAVRQFAAQLYGRALEQSGKTLFLDKTPRYYSILPELRALFPNARFVFLSRNPAAVLSSTLKTWFDNEPAGLQSTSNYRDLTEGAEHLVEGLKSFGDQAIVVRYEDLVTNPGPEIERLCSRIGLAYEPSMLEYGDSAVPSGRHGDQVSIGHHTHAVSDYLDSWRENLAPPARNDFALDYLSEIGPDRVVALGYDYTAIERDLQQARARYIAQSNQVHEPADVINAAGEALYAAGDIEGARRKFEEALAEDSHFVLAHNNLAVIEWQEQNPNGAVAHLCDGLSKQPRHRDLTITAGQIFAALDMEQDAVALYAAYLQENPDDREVRSLQAALSGDPVQLPEVPDQAGSQPVLQEETVRPDTPAPVVAASPITIITSIAPKGLEKQKRAVESWIELGFRVQSLNIQKEIDLLEPEFPHVTFVKASRDGRKLAGRPYVFIDDMLSALKETGNPVVGIVNSDIILRARPSLIDYLNREASGCFLYGSRVDIDRAEDLEGKFYHRGFDLFFFDREVIEKIPKTNFMLGIPWWDYWVPFAPMLHGVRVKRIDTPLGYHVWHETNYSDAQLIQFAREFARECAQAPFIPIYQQCVDGNYGNIRYGVLSDGALDYLARSSDRLNLPEDVSGVTAGRQSSGPEFRVTAIVSTYNSEKFIEGCLENLVTQTIADEIEIIVIDAASPQNERAIVERYQSRYPNIRYHRTPERIGVYAAWNMVAKMARGEYLITCSTNDRLRGDACEILARTLDERPDTDLVYGNSFLTKVPHESFDSPTLFGLYVWPEYSYQLLVDSCMVGPHPMWRRSVHQDVGYFSEELVALSDQEFWLRLGEQHKLLSLPDFTGLYYVSEDSITGDTDLTQIETDQVHAVYQWRYRYAQWFKKRFTGINNTAHDETGLLIEVLVVIHGAGGDALADTLDSVAGQGYTNWKLTVISDDPCPDSLFEEHPQLKWVQASASKSLGRQLNSIIGQDQPDWITLMQAGERLDPAFMSDACAYLVRHSDWHLLYVDDDRADSSGELFDARFKPDFNLELLRASAYIGNACLVSRAAIEAANGFIDADYALLYDLVLRIHDIYGRDALGHLADVRFHRRSADDTAADELAVDFRRQALERHLARCNEKAIVQDAVLPGCFRIEYALSACPKVSVLVPALDANDNLSSCLQSVLAKTDYPDFEVRVLVPAKTDPELKARLDTLSDSYSNICIIAAGNQTEPALNGLAQDAEGDYLVWLDQDIVVLQPEWLTRMLQQGTRDGVGVVGARVINRRKALVSGGVVPGIGSRGVGARCNEGLHMTSPGYMGRAQLDQEIGSVPALCMLVERDLFVKAGGFDPQLSITLYRDVDFCQRVREQGRRVIWTPYVSVMYLGEREQVDGVVKSAKHILGELTLMHQRWLSALARDPAYNRNLSVRRGDYSLECDLVRGWDPEIDLGPRILSYGTGSYGSWQYRVKQPLDVMHDGGVLQRTHTPFIGKRMLALPTVIDIERLQPTALLMHNTMHDDLIAFMENYKRSNDAFIVFGQDDLMTALPPKNPFSKTVYKDVRKRIRKCLSLSDRLVVTTEPLAQALKGMIDDIRVVPNYLDASIWNGLTSQRNAGARPRVGWAGAQQHLGDLELLEEVVQETADEVDWVFFGMCPGFLRPFVKEVHDPVEFAQYPEKLAGLNLDIALAPLEHNRFNESKSNLRLLEYGILGWCVIATDIHPYQDAPVCRVPNRARAWIDAIRARAADLDTAGKEGDCLRDWVRVNWMMHENMRVWLEALDPSSESIFRQGSSNQALGM